MSAAKHTPGPWSVAFQRNEWVAIDSGEGFIATVDVRRNARPRQNDAYEHARADARLIAAAPTLADALASLVRLVETGDTGAVPSTMTQARDALRAAGRLP